MEQTKDHYSTGGGAAAVGARTESEGSTLNNIKTTVAEKLKTAASALDEKISETGGRDSTISTYGRQAAVLLDQSADYVRDLDLSGIDKKIRNEVRQNPGRALLIAGVAGLFIGALLRRR